VLDRGADADVGAAAADVPRHGIVDVGICRIAAPAGVAPAASMVVMAAAPTLSTGVAQARVATPST